MALKLSIPKRTVRYWCLFFILCLVSSLLAMGSGYMAYKLTRESSVTLGFAGIGFYVMFFLGHSFFPPSTK